MSGLVKNSKGFLNGALAGTCGALGGICGKVSFDKAVLKSLQLQPKVLAQIGKILPKAVANFVTVWMSQILQFTGNYNLFIGLFISNLPSN